MKKLLFTIPFVLLAASCSNRQAQVQSAQSQQTQPAQAPAYETTPDMSGWKVYNNDLYRFSVSYPQDYTVQEKFGSIVLSNSYYTLTFTHFTDTIRNQIAARYEWELIDMSNQLPQAAEAVRNSSGQPTMYRFSYFTGGGFETQYLFINHSPNSPADEELGKYNMVAVDVQGDSSQDQNKAQQEGVTNMDTYAYQPDFILSTFKFTK